MRELVMGVTIVEVNDSFLNEVHMLMGLGLPEKMLPDYYGIEKKEWDKLIKRHPAILIKVRQGVAKGTVSVLTSLMGQVKQGNIQAVKLYLEAITKLRIEQYAVFDEVKRSAHNNMKLLTRDPIEASRQYQSIMQAKARPTS